MHNIEWGGRGELWRKVKLFLVNYWICKFLAKNLWSVSTILLPIVAGLFCIARSDWLKCTRYSAFQHYPMEVKWISSHMKPSWYLCHKVHELSRLAGLAGWPGSYEQVLWLCLYFLSFVIIRCAVLKVNSGVYILSFELCATYVSLLCYDDVLRAIFTQKNFRVPCENVVITYLRPSYSIYIF